MKRIIKERPILFSGPMVRAILDGRKTQTRRIVNRVNKIGPVTEFQPTDTVGYSWEMRDRRMLWNELRHEDLLQRCPYGKPGDRLWVREAFAYATGPTDESEPNADNSIIIYRADNTDPKLIHCWKPSIHMPRWASRIDLEITETRVERVQEIGRDGRKAADVLAEGIPRSAIEQWYQWLHPDDAPAHTFGVLWDSINAKRGFGWGKNPWVWVVTFKLLEARP